MGFYPAEPQLLGDLVVAGKTIGQMARYLTIYGLEPDGVDISFYVPAEHEPDIRLMDMTFGLPGNPTWPENHIPANLLPFENSSLISRTIHLARTQPQEGNSLEEASQEP